MKGIPNYEVGYCRPPDETKFKKGQSGNPKGRPKKKIHGIAEKIETELARRIKVGEGGRRQYRTVLELILLMLWTKATQGKSKRALRVFYQFEAFCARMPKRVMVKIQDELQEEIYARWLTKNDNCDDAEAETSLTPNDDPYLITPGMSAREAGERYQKILQDGKDAWDRKQALKRRRYTSSW